MEQKAKISKSVNYLIRGLIIVLTYGFIYRQVFMVRKWDEIKIFLEGIMQREDTWKFMTLLLAMMLLNWSIETLKWKILIRKIEKLSFFRAFKAVLTGISVSLFTPNRTGDYLGRVFILEKGNHIEGILITLIGSFAQIIITFSVGLFCLLSFVDHYLRVRYNIGEYLFSSLIFLVPCLVFVMILLFFKISILSDFFSRYLPSKWVKFRHYADVFSGYTSLDLTQVLLLSFFRYLVFSTQFYLLLRFFGANVPVAEGFILIPVIYLIMAFIPTLALVELGIRGSVAIFVIGLYFKHYSPGTPDTGLIIFAASSVLWFINLVVPAFFGTFFVFNLKFFRK